MKASFFFKFAGSIVPSSVIIYVKKTKWVTILSSEKFVWVRDQVRFQFPLRYPGPRPGRRPKSPRTWSPTRVRDRVR